MSETISPKYKERHHFSVYTPPCQQSACFESIILEHWLPKNIHILKGIKNIN
jgi:hypothetical protein